MMESLSEMEWTLELIEDFEIAYDESQQRDDKTAIFVWREHEWIPGYAAQLIPYLKTIIK